MTESSTRDDGECNKWWHRVTVTTNDRLVVTADMNGEGSGQSSESAFRVSAGDSVTVDAYEPGSGVVRVRTDSGHAGVISLALLRLPDCNPGEVEERTGTAGMGHRQSLLEGGEQGGREGRRGVLKSRAEESGDRGEARKESDEGREGESGRSGDVLGHHDIQTGAASGGTQPEDYVVLGGDAERDYFSAEPKGEPSKMKECLDKAPGC